MRSLVLIAASTAAAIVHLALGPEHLEELGGLGLGFYAAGLLQLGWAVLASMAVLPGRNGRWRLARAAVPAGIALNVALLLAWLISRTVGLPAGERPWTPEAFGLSDGITALLEAGIVIGLLGTIWSGARRGELSRHVAPPVRRRGVRPSTSMLGAASMLGVILIATVTAVSAHEAHGDGMSQDRGGADAAEIVAHSH